MNTVVQYIYTNKNIAQTFQDTHLQNQIKLFVIKNIGR